MSADIQVPNYVFVIDADQYAGNFEREMCAYCTGMVGDCGVGVEGREKFIKDMRKNYEMFLDSILSVADDHGCCRPASIWRTKGKEYNSVAIFFDKKPSKKMIDIMKKRAKEFVDTYPKYTRFKDIEGYAKKGEISILGFRLIAMKIVSEEVEV